MSIQISSGRHRGVARWVRVRRLVRAAVQHIRRRPGRAYERELLTPRAPRPVYTMQAGRARIGYYRPTGGAPTVPLVRDEVRIAGPSVRIAAPCAPLAGRHGTVLAVVGTVVPVAVSVPGVGLVYRDADQLELVNRPASRTLTMAAITADMDADDVPLMGRAW